MLGGIQSHQAHTYRQAAAARHYAGRLDVVSAHTLLQQHWRDAYLLVTIWTRHAAVPRTHVARYDSLTDKTGYDQPDDSH